MLHIWGDMRYTNWLMYLMLVLSIFFGSRVPWSRNVFDRKGGGVANFVKGDIRYTDVTEFKFLSIFLYVMGEWVSQNFSKKGQISKWSNFHPKINNSSVKS